MDPGSGQAPETEQHERTLGPTVRSVFRHSGRVLMSVDIEPRWATVAEAAAEFGVGASTVRRWAAEDRVRTERVGPRRLRVDLRSLTAGATPGLPTPQQLVTALASLDDADVEAIARVARKILPATDDSALVFSHIWQAIGGVARVQAKAAIASPDSPGVTNLHRSNPTE